MFARTQAHSPVRQLSQYLGGFTMHCALVLALLALTLFAGLQPGHAVAAASSIPGTMVAWGNNLLGVSTVPSAAGVRTATVINDDSAENPYPFAVQGAMTVSNAQLNGTTCDLIDAINAANSDTATGTCPAGSSVITDTITLLSDVILSSNYDSDNGLPPISSAIAIDGAGYTISRTVDAPEFRFFLVESSGVLSLNEITLRNGGGINFYAGGGALYIDGGMLTLNNSTLIGNQSGDYGGAIYNDTGTVTVTGSDISGNHTKYDGGAAYNIGGTLTVADSTFAENSAPSRGGAIYNDSSSTLMLTSTQLLSNTSQSSGGAIYNNGSDLTVTDSTIAGNRATATGGAIYSASSSLLTVSDSTFTDNSSESGGGAIHNDSSELTVSDSTFTDNSAPYNGGAINNVNHGQVTLTASTLHSNSTESGGGAISNDNSSELTVSDSTFTENSAPYNGGAIQNVYNSRLTLTNSALLGNSTTSNGGAIYTDSSELTVRDSTFTDNRATYSGGAIEISNSSTVTVSNSSFIDNVAQNSGGGAINNGSTLTVRNSTFSGNQAKYSGGAIANQYTKTLQLIHSTLIGNSAQSAPGGGIVNSGTLTMTRTLVSGNTANPFGDEIYNSGTLNANAFNLIGDSSKDLTRALLNFTPGVNDLTATSDGTVPTTLPAILDTTPADHGGPSTGSGTAALTHALAAGSPAIDAAGDGGFDTDQRGVARPQGCADDIGAFELENVGCPEIDILGNGVSIASGDNEPDPTDHTDFGSADIDGGTVVRTFTISNTGDATLTLSGSPLVTLSGDSAFSITSQPASSSIAAGGRTTFQITFDPSAVEASLATVTIASNDTDESLYTFTIGGIGSERLLPNTHLGAAGTATQSCKEGSPGYVYDCTATFSLSNTSDSVLVIGHYRVNSISAHAYVLNGEPTPGQAGTNVQAGEFVSPGSIFQPQFVVGLTSDARYSIRYSVFGIADAPLARTGTTADELVELGAFEVTFEPRVEGQSFQLYLPTVMSR